jgi:hypothetical protein
MCIWHNLRHQVLLPAKRNPEIEARWVYRCGHALGGLNAWIHTALDQLGDVEAIVDGSGAETARCFFWRKSDQIESTVSAEMIARRFGMPICAAVVDATEHWLSGTPKGDAFFTLDLAYLELRNCPWGYAQSYVDPPLLHFSPYMSRRTVSGMFELPLRAKQASHFPWAVIQLYWPQLLEAPRNKYGDARDWIRVARNLSNVKLVRKKVRKLLAP